MLNLKIENNALNESFLGYGGNLWAGCLSSEGLKRLNMSEAYFEINAQRIMTVRPKLMRVLVMPQYMVDYSDGKDGAENWKKGIYDFESSYMHNFWRYCQAFKRAGTKIELNFGGATSKRVLKWFGLDGMNDMHGGSRSGPRDLEALAQAVAALLKECHRRGFGDTVTYLNFYNESCHANYGAFGDKRVYWCSMLRYVHNSLVEAGLRDKVTVIGADADTQCYFGKDISHKEWLDYIYENAFKKGYCDTLSVHTYFSQNKLKTNTYINDCDDEAIYCNDVVTAYPNMRQNIMVTEYGRENHKNSPSVEGGNGYFKMSLSGQGIIQANAGVSASAYWFFLGSYIPDPICNLQRGGLQLWECPSLFETVNGREYGINAVNSTFGEMGLLMRYVKSGSKVLAVTGGDNSVRTAVYTKDGDTTIALEIDRAQGDREFILDLNGRDGKYYKHIYEFPSDDNMVGAEADSQFDGNAILPLGEEINTEKGKITDKVGKGHYLIVYTTLPNAKQIELEAVKITASVNEAVQIKVKSLIGLTGDIAYEIVPDGLTGKAAGSINGNCYTPDKEAKPGDTVAIKVTAEDEEAYAIAVVEIV